MDAQTKCEFLVERARPGYLSIEYGTTESGAMLKNEMS